MPRPMEIPMPIVSRECCIGWGQVNGTGYPYENQRLRFRMAFGPNNIVFGFIPAYFLNQLDFISIAAGLDLFGLDRKSVV